MLLSDAYSLEKSYMISKSKSRILIDDAEYLLAAMRQFLPRFYIDLSPIVYYLSLIPRKIAKRFNSSRLKNIKLQNQLKKFLHIDLKKLAFITKR